MSDCGVDTMFFVSTRHRMNEVHFTQQLTSIHQGHHLSGKPKNVREFDSCQGNVRDFTKNQENVREKVLSGKSCLKLFIVKCIFASMQVFSGMI